MSVRVKVQLEDTYTQITKVAALAQFLIVGLNESGKPSAVPALAETRNTSQ
jgi:acyl-CoA hydrolase